MLKISALVSITLVLTGFTASAQDEPVLERAWFDEYEAACMAQMSTGEIGEVEAATWIRIAAARDNNALSTYYTVLNATSRARSIQGEEGVVQHDRNGWACKTGVVLASILQSLDVPLTSKNLSTTIKILGSKYSTPEVVLNADPEDLVIGAVVHMTHPDTTEGYLSAEVYLIRLLGLEVSMSSDLETEGSMGGLPITVFDPSLSAIVINSGGAEFSGETIRQLWRDRQQLIGADLWRGVPGFFYFSDDRGMVHVAGTDASQNFSIVSFKPSEPQTIYRQMYERIAAQGFIGDDIYREAEHHMVSAHSVFGIIMAHANVHDAWQYMNFFLDEKMTRPLDEVAYSINEALQELN